MAKRYYVIPMSTPDIDLRRWTTTLNEYGLDVLTLFASVWNAVLRDDKRYHLDAASYAKRVIEQQFYEYRLQSEQGAHWEYLTNEIDKASIECIEVCDRIYDHVNAFISAIEDVETANVGWGIEGYNGNDIVVVCEDLS